VGAHGQGERPRRRRRRVTRTAAILLAAALAAAVLLLLAAGPPPPISLAVDPAPHVRRGAFHIHTTRSDGTLPKAEVAAAAARAGLDFAIFTDHGDGTRPPDPPEYLGGVLCVDGVEISTNDGHYIAIGMPAAPYPLGGDAAAVVEDVARLGGFGVAAHPTSPRGDLSWSDWSLPIDGLEWLNADSEWRDESWARLLRTVLDYVRRPEGALARLLDRPHSALAQWDAITAGRPLVALAGHDAHGGFGAERGEAAPTRRWHVPSYEASFRTFSVYVITAASPTGQAEADAASLLDAIREGRVFTAIDAVAGPAAFEFTATAGDVRAVQGGSLPVGDGPVRFSVRASVPPHARTLLLRNGEVVAATDDGALDHEDEEPGAYRVEIHLPDTVRRPAAPWLVSNPIYRLPSTRKETAERIVVGDALDVALDSWRLEAGAGSAGGVVTDRGAISLLFRLGAEGTRSPFVALTAPLQNVPAGPNEIAFTGRSDEPMRVSVQLRFGTRDDDRWRTSVYLDPEPREVRVPVDRMRPVGPVGPAPAAWRAGSVLFVVDLTNARPGADGRFTVSDVRLEEVRRE
jgi:hypothetical protein